MPSGQAKDPKLKMLKREVAECTKQVGKSKDSKETAFREEQLAKAKAELAKYLQDKPE